MPGQNPENLGLCAKKGSGIPEVPNLVMKDKTGGLGKGKRVVHGHSFLDR